MSDTNSFVIGIVHGDDVDSWFFHSMVDFLSWQQDPHHDRLPLHSAICCRSGPALQMGRGRLVSSFLENTDADALLMIDSDMQFTAETIVQHWNSFKNLREEAGPSYGVLGGLAFIVASHARIANAHQLRPNLWINDPAGTQRYFEVRGYEPDRLLNVGATGAACVMVHRDVFVDIAKTQGQNGRWFYHVTQEDGDMLGEDISFCRRATDAGYKIAVHTGLRYGHSKTTLITEEDYDFFNGNMMINGEVDTSLVRTQGPTEETVNV